MTKLISWITGILTLTVASFAFVVSFASLTEMGNTYRFPFPYLLPLILEVGMVVFSINALYRHVVKEPAKWQWVLVIISTASALSFNILHAIGIESNFYIKIAIYSVPSLFLLLTFENFISQVKYMTKVSVVKKSLKDLEEEFLILKADYQNKSDQLRAEFNQIKVSLEQSKQDLENKLTSLNEIKERVETTIEEKKALSKQLDLEVKSKKSELKSVEEELKSTETTFNPKQQRQKLILTHIGSGINTISDLSKLVNASFPTVSNDIKELQTQGLIIKNGHGLEIKP